jgi:multiple sugar transport system substrate-binding protein
MVGSGTAMMWKPNLSFSKGEEMKKRRLFLLVFTVLALALIVVGCGGTTAAPTNPPAAAPTKPLAAAATTAPAPQAPKPLDVVKWDYPNPPFNNVTLTVVGDAGQNLAPWEFWKDELKKAGITIKIVEVPFDGVYEKEKTEFIAGSGAFDIVTFYPTYIGDFAGNGYLEPLDAYIQKQPASVWDPNMADLVTPFRELYDKWNGKTYALTIDGDIHMMVYRKDLFENADEQAAFKTKYGKDLKPPETWDDWLQIGQFFTRKKGEKLAGQVLDKDFYGSADFAKRGFSYAWFVDRWAGNGQLYFDAAMKPMINSPEAVKALQNMVDSKKNSPPDELGYGYDELKDALLKGNVAMVIQWTDVPKKGFDPAFSTVPGKIGQTRVPGVNVNGTVVHKGAMPVGRVLAVAAGSKNKEAAYWAIKHIAYDRSLEDVSTNLTGLDPNRTSHTQNPAAYSMFPTPKDAQEYLTGVGAALADGFPEPFIPGAAQYEDSLDLHVNKALAGEETPQVALDNAAKEWNAITDKLGRDKQLQFWTQALQGYKSVGMWK